MPLDGNSPATTSAADISDAAPAAIDAAIETPGSNAAAPVAGPQDDDAALDALIGDLNTGKSRDDLTATYEAARSGNKAPAVPQITPAAEKPAGAAAAGTTPAEASAQPAPLAPEARDLLSRFKVKESTFAKLDEQERVELLGNLKERHDTQARLYQDNQRLAGFLRQQPAGKGAPQQQQAPNPAAPLDPYAQIDAALAPFLEEGQAISAPLKAALAPMQQQLLEAQQRADAAEQGLAHFWKHREQQDQADGLKAVKIDGVNLDKRTAEGKGNHAKLLETAQRLLNAAQQQEGWTPFTYGWKEAIAEASPTVFKAQTILAQRRAATEQARKAAQRGGDPGGLPNRSQPKDSEDAILNRILDAQKAGATRDELMAIGAGRS